MDEGESGPRVGWVEGLARVEGARSYAATHRAALMTAPGCHPWNGAMPRTRPSAANHSTTPHQPSILPRSHPCNIVGPRTDPADTRYSDPAMFVGGHAASLIFVQPPSNHQPLSALWVSV